MLARCINERCKRPLHSFPEGRLFQYEITSISLAATDESSVPFDEKPKRETVHFWLCGPCASRLTLILEPARGLRLVALDEQKPSATDDASSEPDGLHLTQC
jgi:hypothetical protein